VPALEVEALRVRYGPLTAVHGLALTVDEGTIAVVLGSNGAGKSSTLNALSGIAPTAGGRVRFEGADITGWPAHRVARAGLVQVPEGRRIIAPLSVEENLLLGSYALKSKRRRAALLRDTLDLFPILADRRDSPAGLLSGGEQQMLAFGRALMSDPRMLMLDEPSMGLAPVVVDVIMRSVRDIAARGLSILMVEQNAAAALDVAATAYVVEQGELVLAGPADAVARDPRVVRAFLGIDG
jgi:branched-chain amino acid transport system ATP-binding protein